MAKNRFINNEVKKIDIGDGDWIKVKNGLSFDDYQKVMKNADMSQMKKLKEDAEGAEGAMNFSNFDIAIPLLKAALTDWSFTDKDGKKIDCTHENIDKLTPRNVLELLEFVSDLIHLDDIVEKKSSQS